MHKLLTSTEVAKRVGLSAVAFNKHLQNKGVMYRRGRESRKHKGVHKPYWWIDDDYLKFGVNKIQFTGGSIPRWYESRVDEFINSIGLGGVL